MKSTLAHAAFSLLSRLPLSSLHSIGRTIAQLSSSKSRFYRRIVENIEQSRIANTSSEREQLIAQTLEQLGMSALETPLNWKASSETILSLVVRCSGWEFVEAALKKQHGILFLTPHLGNYDIAGRYLTLKLPNSLTAMYRPPKLTWLDSVMLEGRKKDSAIIVPANVQGVRQIMKALKQGHHAMILPDQVPAMGDGVWVDFFGKPAYTMTLAARLGIMNNVDTLLFYGKRLPDSQGFEVVIRPLPEAFTGDKTADAARLNRAIEQLILESPAQYLWSYNRYKGNAPTHLPNKEMEN